MVDGRNAPEVVHAVDMPGVMKGAMGTMIDVPAAPWSWAALHGGLHLQAPPAGCSLHPAASRSEAAQAFSALLNWLQAMSW